MAFINLTFRNIQTISYHEILLGIAASALTAAALFAALIPAFPSVSGSWIIYALVGAIYATLFYVLMLGRYYRWVITAVSAGMLVLYAIRFRAARNGMMLLANDWLTYRTGRTGRVHFLYETNGTDGSMLMPFLYVFLAAIIIAAIIRRRRYLGVLILVGLCLLGWAFGFLKNNPASLLLTAIAAVVSLYPCGAASARKRGPSGLAYSALIIPGAALAAAAAVCGLGIWLFGSDAFSTQHAQESLTRRVHIARFESHMEKNPLTGERLPPEGFLRGLPPLSDRPADSRDQNSSEEQPVLELTMSSPGKLYLRGFTADVYEDSLWRAVPAETYIENDALFYTLHENGFYGQAMIGTAAEAVGGAGVGTVTVTNLAACPHYDYLPYGLADTSVLNERMIGDAGLIAGRESASASGDSPAARNSAGASAGSARTFSTITGSLPEWYAIELALAENSADPAVSDYLKLEQAYYDYVLATDLQLSDEAAEACVSVFGDIPRERRLRDILDLVRDTLDEEFRYDETAGSRSGDFLARFMTETQSGYDIHYASAATVMLRYLGVPARYVEGYFLPADEAAAYASGEPITLTTAHAHAWTEFYLRGIGWIPFETTPGYIDSEDLSSIAAVSRQADDSLGEGTLFSQAEILYTSGIHTNKPLLDPDSLPRLDLNRLGLILLASFVILLVILALIALIRILKRRQRYIKARRSMTDSAPNEAVALQFGYARMLMKKAGIETMPDLDAMNKLNEEARFSSHVLSKEDVQTAAGFTSAVESECQRRWSRLEFFKNHFIRWII